MIGATCSRFGHRVWVGLLILSLAGMLLGQEPAAQGDVEIGNWPAPASWTPPEGSAARVGGVRPEAVESTPTGALPFTGIAPCRMFDSRVTGGPIASGTTRTIPLTGAPCGIPANAAAVSVNVAVFAIVGTSSNGVLVVYPAGSPSTSQALLNWSPTVGQIDNASVVILGTGGAITVQPNQGSGSISLVVDVNGYYGGGVVTSVNGLINDVTLAAGSNVTITPSGQTLTIASTGGSGGITQIDAGTGLTGGGSSGVVTLGIATGGVGTTQIAANAITAPKVASGQVVKNVNGLFDGVTLAGGSGIAITPSGQTLTIASTAPAAWGLGGNAGLGCTTSPCAAFLGTTDAGDAFEARVANRRAFRVEPATNSFTGYTPNIVGGFEGNGVTALSVAGATIAGGGYASSLNTVSATLGTIGGGAWNTASGQGATISGGYGNIASGQSATIGGGQGNHAGGQYSTVPGGSSAAANGIASFAAGQNVTVSHDGTFAWSDGTAVFSDTGSNQFLVQATGGFGINTNAPAAALDVAGMIRSSTGGFKFPDGTTQATAGLTAVSHDTTLTGNGTGATPLGIAAGGIGTSQLAANAVTASKIAAGQVVKSVNGLFDGVTLVAGTGIVISPAGQTLTFSSTGWGLAGNAGTGCTVSPCAEFLGTTDNDAMESRVNNRRAFRIEPATDSSNGYSPNIVGGFESNAVASSNVAGATIAGGGFAGNANTIAASFGTVCGGWSNAANGIASVVSGGHYNIASGNPSVVAGGDHNTASGNASAVSGGDHNVASNYGSVVSGGGANTASGNYSAVSGGASNNASGFYAAVPGGTGNTASGTGSLAAGQHADADASGCFVWGDGTGVVSCGGSPFPNRFVVLASGGTFFYSNSTGTTGVILQPGSGSWSSVSDRNLKENFEPVDGGDVLRRLLAIPITTWDYKGADAPYRHLGPMAQDFYSAFRLGEDDRHITTIDEGGVALAAIQGLAKVVEEKDAKIRALETRLEALETIVNRAGLDR